MSDIRSDTQNKNRRLLKNSSGITVNAVVPGCMLIIFVAAIAAAVLAGTAGAAS